MADLTSDLDLEMLARGTNEKLYSNISSKKLIGGDDENSMGMIMLAVVMGCIAAIILLYIVRQHTTLPESIAELMDKKLPVVLNNLRNRSNGAKPINLKIEKGEKEQIGSGEGEDEHAHEHAHEGTEGSELKEVKKEPEAEPEPEPVPAQEPVPVANIGKGPRPMKKSSAVKLSAVSNNQTMSQSLSSKEMPQPRLPGVPKANNIEGSNKVLEANKQLIEAAQTGDLRKKLSRASWGIAPVRDSKDGLPYYSSSKDMILTPERERFLKDQVSKNTTKILNAGAVPVLFDLPQNFNMKPTETPTVGASLKIEEK